MRPERPDRKKRRKSTRERITGLKAQG